MTNETKGPTVITPAIQLAIDARRVRFRLELQKCVDEWLEENKIGEYDLHTEKAIIASISQWGDE